LALAGDSTMTSDFGTTIVPPVNGYQLSAIGCQQKLPVIIP